jgi:hypothetical protein
MADGINKGQNQQSGQTGQQSGQSGQQPSQGREKDKDNTAQKIPSSSKKEGHNEESEVQEHGGQRRAS